ncbi:MAG: uroporphyrinogen-III C-methyltransferase, partial [Actinobacteria bacterium]|nr:uroporphyrinogen-III C-methyltransferase [Actinomycetota bacterium]
QDEINELLVDRGKQGLTVVRLKGGDPFVFGRGGEECAALAAAGVPFEVVPGVTSASAAPAYAGVPLTYRGLSSSVTIVTGRDDSTTPNEADWEAVARMGMGGGTIVVLMGAAGRDEIAHNLMDNGLDAATPVTAVTWGTRPEQVTVRTTLGGLGAADVNAPVTIVIGAVAALADELAWFRLPLADKRIVVAAPSGDGAAEPSFGERIAAAAARTGAHITPLVTGARVSPTDGGAALRDAIAQARSAAWVTFASVASVEAFASAAPHTFAFGDALVAVVGVTTADAFEAAFDRPADLVADPPNGASLAAAVGDAPDDGSTTVLVIGAEDSTADLPEGLRVSGWEATPVAAYRLGPPPHSEVPARDTVDGADAVVCTSSSAATFLVTHGGLITATAPVVAIGPSTAETLARAGLPPARVVPAASPAVTDIVDALLTCLS